MAKVGIGIDLGVDSLKIVQGRFKGDTFVLNRARRVRLPAGDPVQGLRAALNSAGVKGSGLLGLTGKDVIIRYTQVPPVTPQRLKTLMEFEVNEIIQQSGGDVVADYAFLPLDEGPDEEDLVLLGLVKDQFLADRMDAVKEAGSKIEGACPNSVALFNCFLKNGDFRSEEVTLILNIGADNCDIALQKNAQLIFARNQAMGGSAFTQAIADTINVDRDRAEKLKQLKADLSVLLPGRGGNQDAERLARALVAPAGRLFSLIQSTVTFAKNQSKIYNLKLDRVMLCGGGSRLKGLDEYLSNSLGVPVETFDPMGAVDTSALPEADGEDAEKAGADFAVALGLAQMAVDQRFFRISLLPEKVRKAIEFRRSTAFMIAAGVLVAAFCGLSYLSAKRDHDAARAVSARLNRERQKITRNMRTLGELRQENMDLRAKVELLAKRHNFGPAAAKAWRAVQAHLPPEFWVKDMDMKLEPYVASNSAKPAVRRFGPSSRDDQPLGPELPRLSLIGGGKAQGRKLVPLLNEYVAKLEEDGGVKKIERKDKIGSGKLEFTLDLYMVAPPQEKTDEEDTEASP